MLTNRKMNTITKTNFNFPNQTNLYKGKVRDVYTIGNDKLVMIASDRISAFDHVLPKGIPYKGQVLNQIASKFLDATADILPNWKEASPDPSVTVGKRCEPFKVEMVIRGYLTGHAWREYKSGKRLLCGVPMPDGMLGAVPRLSGALLLWWRCAFMCRWLLFETIRVVRRKLVCLQKLPLNTSRFCILRFYSIRP